jgi:hypothetical protein
MHINETFRRGAGLIAVASVLFAALAGCGAAADSGGTTHNKVTPVQFGPQPGYDRNSFHASTHIDNTWFPLKPGAQFTYEGKTVEDGQAEAHRIVTTVTDATKVVDGVPTVVVWDRDYKEGELEEAEVSFFAQADDGDIWSFGEYPEEIDNGEIVGVDSWIAGFEGAKPGILVKEKPEANEASYAQGWGPKVQWTDRAEAYKLNQKTCVPVDCYDGVLVNEEFSKEEPGAYQLKYYAPGVGNVRVGFRGTSDEVETLVLTKIEHLGPSEMADVSREIHKIDGRAIANEKAAYRQTKPMEIPSS